MKKIYLMIIVLICSGQLVNAQWSITDENPIIEDFNTYTGSGLAPEPAAGQLDSDTWMITGMSDGATTFGGTHTTLDFARGIFTGSTTGGAFAMDVSALSDGSDYIFGVKPGSSDFTPGDLILKIQNNTGNLITQLLVSYDVFTQNSQSRSNSWNFSHSVDNSVYTSVPSLDFASGLASDVLGFVSEPRMTTITGLTIADGDFYYLKWTCDEAGGSGSRDEMGMDNLSITATTASATDPIAQIIASFTIFETAEGLASANQVFAVGGNNLTGDITVTAPTGFEVSMNGTDFFSFIDLAQIDVEGITSDVYARISTSSIVGSLDGVITVSTPGASDVTVVVTGLIVSTTSLALPYDQSLKAEPDGWYVWNESSSLTWSYSSSGYFIANAFSDDAAAEDWLISPPLDGSTAINAHFSFESRKRFTDAGEADPLRVYYSTDYLGYGDPGVATWTDVSSSASMGSPVGGSNDPHTFSDFIDVSALGSKFYVAFVYLSSGFGLGNSSEVRLGEFSVGEFTEWDGTGEIWSNGAPDMSTNAKITGTFMTSSHGTSITANDLYVAPGLLSITAGNEVSVYGELTNNGELFVQSGAGLAIFGTFSSASIGTTLISRNTTGNGGYSILGAPIADATLASLSADYLYGYDETATPSKFTQPTGAMTAGVGYFVGFDAASPSVSFTGTPNTGTVTSAIIADGEGFNLVANPYAAAISMSMYRASNSTDTDGVIYLWDDGGTNEGADRGGDYITVNDVGAVSTVDLAGTGLTGEGPAGNGFIASTQGFFVKALAAGSVTFTPDMQSTTSGANADVNHYRQAEEKQLLRLSISGNGLYNEILLGLMESATLGVDRGLDAFKFSGNELISFYSMIDDSKFAIQALPNVFDQLLEVQLGLDLAEAGTYTFNVNELQGIADDMDVTLFDNVTGLSYNLSEVESITFTNAASSFNDQRFKLVLSKAAVLGFDLNKSSDAFKVFMNEGGLNIETKFVFDNAEVNIYTLSGALVNTYHKVDFSTQKSTILFNRNGLFIITIQTDDQLMVKKFLN